MSVATEARAELSDAALARVTAVLAANAERYDRTAEFPWESIHAVHEARLLTFGIGAAYGGRDVSVTDVARVLQALGKGDPSVALLTAMTVLQHVGQAKAPRWPDALYRKIVAESFARPIPAALCLAYEQNHSIRAIPRDWHARVARRPCLRLSDRFFGEWQLRVLYRHGMERSGC